jgi:hypothetical protein
MSIELTEEQRQAVLNGQPVHLSDPDTGSSLVLLSADARAELLKDEEQHRAFRQAGLKSAIRWLQYYFSTPSSLSRNAYTNAVSFRAW